MRYPELKAAMDAGGLAQGLLIGYPERSRDHVARTCRVAELKDTKHVDGALATGEALFATVLIYLAVAPE